MDKFWENYITTRPTDSKGAFEEFKQMHQDPRPMAQGPRNMQLAKADIPRHLWTNMNTPDLEQSPDSFLRPGETLEDFDVSFRRPNADGGVQQLVTPSIDGSRPGYNLGKRVLQNISKKKIPGITYYPPGYTGKTTENTISFLTRTTDKTGKRTSKTKTFNINEATEKKVNAYLNQEKKSLEGKVQVKGGDVNIVRANYTEAKKGFTNELINWLETNAHNSKYKNPEQLLAAAKKVFNTSKYTEVPAKVEKSKAFFTKEKGFVLPKEFEFYGKMIDTKNPAKVHNDMAMIALLKSNNPNFKGKKETLMKFFNRDPDSPKPILSKAEDTFLKNFSKTYIKSGFGEKGVTSGASEGSVMIRFLKKEGADFKNKLNNWNEIRRLETDIKKELALEGLSPNRIAFLNRALKETVNKRKTISEALRKDYPDLFTGKKGDITGALVQEHKIARALGETSESFIPGTYLARSEFTPAAFNLQKLKDFDTPFMSLVEKYNKAVPKDRPGIIKQIKELKADFNKASGGYLNDVDITFGKTVKIKDKTPYLFDVSKEDTYKQILKNIKHSNTYFKNKGMDKYVLTGNSYNKFQRDLKNRIASSEKGSVDMKSLLGTLGIGGTSSVFAYNFLPSSAKAAGTGTVEKAASWPIEHPWLTGGGAAGVAATTKQGRSILGKGFRTLGTKAMGPLWGASIVGENLKSGKGVAESVLDPWVGAVLAGQGTNVSKITSKPALKKFLDLSYKIPGTAWKLKNVTSPIGWGILGTELATKVAKDSRPNYYINPETQEPTFYKREKASDVLPTFIDIYDQANKIAKEKGIPYQEALQQIDASRFYNLNKASGGRAGYMGGGIAAIRKPSAIPPTGGPQSGGLPSLYNNVRKL